MEKTSKTVPQKEKASFSRPSGDKTPVEPSIHNYVPGPCTLKIDFKVENPSSVPGRCEHVSTYMCSITEDHLEAVRKDSAPWMPQAVPDLEDWVRKLASTSSYAECAWRDLAKGVTKDAALRPSSGEERTKSPVPQPGKDKKRKASSRLEDPKPKTQRVRRKAIALSIDSVQRLREEEEEEEDEDNALALVIRYAKAIEVARAPKPMAAVPVRVGLEVPSLDRSNPSDLLGAMMMGHSPSLPTFSKEALKEARELKTPDIGGGSSVGDPFRDFFTGVDDASNIGDASLLLEEAECFITRAINRFRVDLSQCEAKLWKVSGERDALRLLCSQKDEAIKELQVDLAKVREERVELDKQIGLLREEVDQIKAECNWWKETLDRLAAEKETIVTKLLSADVQLRSVKQKGSAQAKKIEELEIRLAEAKAEVESSKVLANKSIAVSRRETLKEIHAWGFDLTEEIKRAKELEAEAEALASDDDDDDDGGSKSGSEDGEELDSGANAP
ncbi:uncharacterized protein [Nicotiana tomentosiformis]|uniref:uncharacterized protein n=1 Tax=Nicotiana tomentosiformis TaxID=4098 RepID=UPI00388CA2FD